MVDGNAALDVSVRMAGVILNRVGSEGHETLLREALAPLGIPVVGALHRDDALTWRDRHLGLVPVVEQPEAVAASLDRLAATIAERCDLDAIVRLAGAAPRLATTPPPEAEPAAAPGTCRLAVAAGP